MIAINKISYYLFLGLCLIYLTACKKSTPLPITGTWLLYDESVKTVYNNITVREMDYPQTDTLIFSGGNKYYWGNGQNLNAINGNYILNDNTISLIYFDPLVYDTTSYTIIKLTTDSMFWQTDIANYYNSNDTIRRVTEYFHR